MMSLRLVLGKGLGQDQGHAAHGRGLGHASSLENLVNGLENASQGVANPNMHDALVIGW